MGTWRGTWAAAMCLFLGTSSILAEMPARFLLLFARSVPKRGGTEAKRINLTWQSLNRGSERKTCRPGSSPGKAWRQVDPTIRFKAWDALTQIGPLSVGPLIALAKKGYAPVAGVLGGIREPRAAKYLNANGRGEFPNAGGAYGFFIEQGKPGSEVVLARALKKHGHKKMAEAIESWAGLWRAEWVCV